jgi:catechol 2,3-dioxygenase-like lactoylglutathione lyase family enzyme
MTRTELNHVSVVTNDIEESVSFYEDVFDFETIPTPNFNFPGQWLEMADKSQLHLFGLETPAPRYHHFGVSVEDFEAVYYEARERGILTDFSDDEDSSRMYKLPDDAVQMYVLDPSHNVIEVNWPDANTLDESIQEQIIDRNDLLPQDDEHARATLHLERSAMY